MQLMNADMVVLWFDQNDYSVVVLNDAYLPYALRGRIRSSTELCSIKEHLYNFDLLRHYFAGRVLAVSRQNAKSILQSIGESQRLTEEQSYQLALKCHALSVSDNFWVKEDVEDLTFAQVNLRKQHLADVLFQVCVEGTPVSLQHSVLAADISVGGMFRKTWYRDTDGLYLYKSDLTTDFINTKCEVYVSKLLNTTSVSHVKYEEAVRDNIVCCRCKCFTDDLNSFVSAQDIKDWCNASGKKFEDFLSVYAGEFANMVVCDYVLANPDRHLENWGFIVDENNEIKCMAPLFDHNQALIALKFGKDKDFDDLIYPSTNRSIRESVIDWARFSDVEFPDLPEELQRRMQFVERCKRQVSSVFA